MIIPRHHWDRRIDSDTASAARKAVGYTGYAQAGMHCLVPMADLPGM